MYLDDAVTDADLAVDDTAGYLTRFSLSMEGTSGGRMLLDEIFLTDPAASPGRRSRSGPQVDHPRAGYLCGRNTGRFEYQPLSLRRGQHDRFPPGYNPGKTGTEDRHLGEPGGIDSRERMFHGP